MKKRLCLLISIILIFAIGCWDQKIYEEIGFILQVGIESAENDQLLVTYTSPVIGGEIKNSVEIVTVKAHLLREGRENARMVSPKTLEGGKIQQVLLSEEIAQKGMYNLLEIFQRDPINPALAYVSIVEGSPNQLLRKAITFGDKPRAAFYINQLLDGNAKSSYIPATKVYDFSIDYFIPGVDPITSMVKLEPDSIKVTGTALFSGDKMVGKLNTMETSYLLTLMNKLKKTEYILSLPSSDKESKNAKKGMALLIKDAKRKLDVKIVDDRPVVSISLEIDATVDEYGSGQLNIIENQRSFEHHASKEVTQHCMKILEYTQEVGSDPLGIGEIIRANYNDYWQEGDWKDIYKIVEFKVNTKVDIIYFGTIH